MKELLEILMERDGLSFDDATDVLVDLKEELISMMDEGCSLTEIEDYFSDETGLEPDYLMDYLMEFLDI